VVDPLIVPPDEGEESGEFLSLVFEEWIPRKKSDRVLRPRNRNGER
jgi:hypothetical protein